MFLFDIGIDMLPNTSIVFLITANNNTNQKYNDYFDLTGNVNLTTKNSVQQKIYSLFKVLIEKAELDQQNESSLKKIIEQIVDIELNVAKLMKRAGYYDKDSEYNNFLIYSNPVKFNDLDQLLSFVSYL